ncbi:hypothetical protein [Caminibacter sp.]
MKILIWILSFLILFILGYVYVKISAPEVEFKPVKEVVKPLKKEISLKKPEIYNFPARILYMKIDFRTYKNIILYKLALNVNDRYAVFNIKAILDNYGLIYSLLEEKKEIKIYILFKSLAEAEKILNLFKEYNFNVKIEKIKKRI